MAILVTGGTGFTGSNIVRELAERGNEVVSLDIIPPDELVRRYLAPWAKQVTWLTGDIADKATLDAASAYFQIDKIVHAAAYTSYGDAEKKNGRRACDINLEGTLNMLDLARRMEVKRFIYVSTNGAYYGLTPQGQPFGEDIINPGGFPLAPVGFYLITKLASELLTQRYAHLYGFEAACIRMAQNWGPMDRVTPYHSKIALPTEWTARAVRGEPIEASPYGKGITEGRRFDVDHPYVKDTAAAVAIMLDAPALKYPVYNISTGRPLFLHDMISAIREAYPGVKFVEPIPKQEEDPFRGRGRFLDITRMREDLKFTPRYDLVSALKDCIAWRQDFNFLD